MLDNLIIEYGVPILFWITLCFAIVALYLVYVLESSNREAKKEIEKLKR